MTKASATRAAQRAAAKAKPPTTVKPALKPDEPPAKADVSFGAPTPANQKLVAIGRTLMSNLNGIPMVHWNQPIMQGLRSAYMLGKAESLREEAKNEPEGEDHALEHSPDGGVEEIGHDFLNAMAAQLGALAPLGFRPSELSLKWMVVNTADGQQVLAGFPCAPIAYANKFPK